MNSLTSTWWFACGWLALIIHLPYLFIYLFQATRDKCTCQSKQNNTIKAFSVEACRSSSPCVVRAHSFKHTHKIRPWYCRTPAFWKESKWETVVFRKYFWVQVNRCSQNRSVVTTRELQGARPGCAPSPLGDDPAGTSRYSSIGNLTLQPVHYQNKINSQPNIKSYTVKFKFSHQREPRPTVPYDDFAYDDFGMSIK